MFPRFATRSLTLMLGAILITTVAGEAQADQRQKRRVIVEEHFYAPGFFERIPGVRTLFGDYALTEEEYDALYGPGRRHFDESYYEPEPVAPVKPKTKPSTKQSTKSPKTPVVKTPVVKSAPAPSAPSIGQTAAPKSRDVSTTASVTPKTDSEASPPKAASPTKTASAAPAKGISCDKATSIVSEFGFTGVTAQNCSGKVYAFNATRGGKNFAIKVDPASGELTEVKKLQ